MSDMRQKIVIVDDEPAILLMGRDMLKPFYEVYPAQSVDILFEILENVDAGLILMDIEMPGMNGYEAIKILKAEPRFADIPVIFLSSKTDESSELEGFSLGATDYITKPFSAPRLVKRIANQLLIAQQKKDLSDYAENLEIKVREKTGEVLDLQNAVIETVADMVEFRDKLTGSHIARTTRYLKALTDELIKEGIYADKIRSWNMNFFLLSAQLHDVGKIAISDLILNKPIPLSLEEMEIMKTHVTVGVKAIEGIIHNTNEHAFLNYALLIAGTHHEKWDGSGYPKGLKGKEIPLEGRLMAIADVYDALVTIRPYKKAFTHDEACKIIEDSAGTHFDPVLVDVFRNVKAEFARTAKESINVSYV